MSSGTTPPLQDGARARSRSRARLVPVLLLALLALLALWRGLGSPAGAPADGGPPEAAARDAPAPAPDGESASRRRTHVTADAAGENATAPPAEAPLLRLFVRAEAGAPVAGVTLLLSPAGSSGAEVVVSAADGRAVAPLPSRATFLSVRLTAAQARRYLPVPPQELPAATGSFTVTLVEGATVRGRIVGPDGAPLDSVYVRGLERPGDRELSPVLTDDAGRFEALVARGAVLDLELDGMARRVRQDQRGAVLALREEVPWWGVWTGLAAGPDEHALRAAALARHDLVVRVTTPEGEPLEGAAVRTRLGRWDSIEEPVCTGPGGTVRLQDLAARARTVEVHAPAVRSGGPAWADAAPVHVEGSAEEVTIVLVPAAHVAGRVVRTDGKAASYSGIDVVHGDRTIASATSAQDGSFEVALPQDAPAPLRLSARLYDRAGTLWTGEVDGVWPGARNVEIPVSPPE